MINIEEMIGKTYYRPVPKIDHKNDTKEFVPEEVMLTKKCNTFYWGNEQCHPSWLIGKTLVFFETKEECQNKCHQFNYENGWIKIDTHNIHLYYEFMSDEQKNQHRSFISDFMANRALKTSPDVLEEFNSLVDIGDYKRESINKKTLQIILFGIKDTLKPIDQYIAEIKDSEQYKILTSECRCNNCMTYFESDDDLLDAEDEDGEFKACPECNTDAYLMDLSDLK